MKILLSNYTNQYSTEPTYLNTAFNIAGCQSTIWPNNISTFDIFDTVKPDVHITHHSKLSLDLAIYLQESKNIDLIINITGLNQSSLIELEDKLSSFNIKPLLYFVNHHETSLKSKKTNLMTLLHGADIFFSMPPKQYTIEYGIFINNKNQIESMDINKTYHYISNDEDMSKYADMSMPIQQLVGLWGNYSKIVFKYFNNALTQTFFDAVYYNNNVYFDIKDRSVLDRILIKMFGDGKYCDLNIDNSGDIASKIKQKHTCLHRAKSLLSQLPCKEQTDQIQKVIEGALQ